MNIADWSGDGKTPENRLIESTAKWAGFRGENAEKIVNLTKAFIGDTIIKKAASVLTMALAECRSPLAPTSWTLKTRPTQNSARTF